jgi:Caspase domain
MVEGARHALIVASSDYADPELRQLRAPGSDARALEAVLRDPEIGDFEVRTLINRPNQEVALAVEDFFADRQPDDLLLLHFSCHGIKDENGELYFAMTDSLLHRLAATAVPANFVNQRMTRSRSKRVVLLLDCCYAGAFERGMMARAGGGMGIEAQLGGGRGRAVITASDAMQYAYEGGELAVAGELAPSVFTSALVSGLQTGEADRDQDGQVDLDELYDYIYEKVHAVTPNQTPCKWTYDVRGELFIARRSCPVTTPSKLPDDIQGAVENRLASVRLGVVQELEPLLHGKHAGLALAARLTLQQLADDDSRAVSAAATAALGSGEPPTAPQRPEPSTHEPSTVDDGRAVSAAATAVGTEEQQAPPGLEPSTTVVEFRPLVQHSQSPEFCIRLGNTGGGNLNAHAVTEASWIRLRQVGDKLYIAVDTGMLGEHEGAVTVNSDGGSAAIQVKASVAPALQPTSESADAISVAAAAVPAEAVPAAVPATDSSPGSTPRPDALSGEGRPAPTGERAAAETALRPAPRGRSGAVTLLDAGSIILVAVLFIAGTDALIPKMFTAIWPWWVVLIASTGGIAVTLGAFRQYSVYASIITWVLAWNLTYSISVIAVWNSLPSTAIAVLRAVCIVGAVVSVALCIWVIVLLSGRSRNVDPFLAIFLGCLAVALTLAAIAAGKQLGPIWYATGIVTIAAALVLPLALMRIHRQAAASAAASS